MGKTEATEALRSAVGFAMKAGKLKSGDFSVDKAVKTGRAGLVILDSEASENTIKRWKDACKARGIPLIFIENLGGAIGKAGRMVAAVTDKGFSEMIMKKLSGSEIRGSQGTIPINEGMTAPLKG